MTMPPIRRRRPIEQRADHSLNQAWVEINRLRRRPAEGGLDAHLLYGSKHTESLRIFYVEGSGLTINYQAGHASVLGEFYNIAAGTIAMANNTMNYVFVDINGVVATNTTGYPPWESIALARVTTSGGVVTAINDERAYLRQDAIGASGPFIWDYLVDQDYTGPSLLLMHTQPQFPVDYGGFEYRITNDFQDAIDHAQSVAVAEGSGHVSPRTFWIRGSHQAYASGGGFPQSTAGQWTFVGSADPHFGNAGGGGGGFAGSYSTVGLYSDDIDVDFFWKTLVFRNIHVDVGVRGTTVIYLQDCGGGSIAVNERLHIYAKNSYISSLYNGNDGGNSGAMTGKWEGGAVGVITSDKVQTYFGVVNAEIGRFEAQDSFWENDSPLPVLEFLFNRIGLSFGDDNPVTVPTPSIWVRDFVYSGVYRIIGNDIGIQRPSGSIVPPAHCDAIHIVGQTFNNNIDSLDISHNTFHAPYGNASTQDLSHCIHIEGAGPGSAGMRIIGLIKNNIWATTSWSGGSGVADIPNTPLLVENPGDTMDLTGLAIENNVPLAGGGVGGIDAPGAILADPSRAPTDGEYVIIGTDPDLPDARTIVAGAGVDIDDAGPGGDLTFESFLGPTQTAAALTIATGAITLTPGQYHYTIDTEASATSDDLETINGLEADRIYIFKPADGSRTVVLKHNTGNILCIGNSDLICDDPQDFVIVIPNAAGSFAYALSGVAAGSVDASNVTYTPSDNADWNSGVDPGDTDQALDQLVGRLKDLETDVAAGIAGAGLVSILHNDAGVVWTDQPAALTEVFGSTALRTKVDLSRTSTVRLVAVVGTAGATGAKLRAQYSTDESSWNYLDGGTGPEVAIDATGVEVSTEVALAVGAQADVFLRIVGVSGDGSADPVLNQIVLQFDLIGASLTVPEGGDDMQAVAYAVAL